MRRTSCLDKKGHNGAAKELVKCGIIQFQRRGGPKSSGTGNWIVTSHGKSVLFEGPYKCGKTGGDVKKRAKEMQTGNLEEMRVVARAKYVDSHSPRG